MGLMDQISATFAIRPTFAEISSPVFFAFSSMESKIKSLADFLDFGG